MSEELAPVPIADGTIRRLFDEPQFRVVEQGYHPDDVAAFLDHFGTRMMQLIGRVQGAQKSAKSVQGELDSYRLRAEQAETSRELFDRTLVLAEETANASVADAKHRADRIDTNAHQTARRMVDETHLRVERMMDSARDDVQRVYVKERQSIADAQAGIQSESDQLETLRLAVAAETMALEEVRNELRRRIRRAATNLLDVAESPDCLGTPMTRGIPEVVARQSSARLDQERSLPSRPTEEPVAVAGVRPPTRAIDLVEPAEDPGDDGVTVVADQKPTAPDQPEDAFDRFMSEEIEEEPSRSWILT